MRLLNFRSSSRGDVASSASEATAAAKDAEVPLVLATDVSDPVLLHHTTPPKGTSFDRLTRAQLIADLEAAHTTPPADTQ
jgi:hypothetical protein